MRARRTIAVATMAVVLLDASAAMAYYASAGAGGGSGAVGTLAAPDAPVATYTSGTSVGVAWTGVVAPDLGPPDGYYVVRHGAGSAPACGTSSSALTSAMSCTDAGVPDGTSTYRVTAVFRSWTATSPASNAVTVVSDTTPPVVSSIVRAGSTPTNAASVSWTVTFSEPVSGVGAGDFSPAVTGLGGPPAITGVLGPAPSATWTVTASTGTGQGTLGLNLVDDDSIVDGAGNPLGGPGAGNGNATGPVYAIDRIPPTVSSVNRAGSSPTNAASVSWTVTFSESVSGFGAADLSLVAAGPAGATITAVSAGPGAVYTVSASTGLGDGTLRLDVVDDDSIIDAVGNPLAGAADGGFTGQTYVADKTAPAAPGSVALANGQGEGAAYINAATASAVSVTVSGLAEVSASATVMVTLTNGVTSVQASAPASSSSVTITGINASSIADGTGTITISAVETDAAGNTSGSTAAPQTYSKDTVGPTQTGLASANSGAGGSTVGFADAGDTVTATFSETIRAASVPAAANLTLTTANGNNRPVVLTMAGLGSAPNINGNNENQYIAKNGGTITFNTSALSQPAVNQVRVTLGACSAGCSERRVGQAHPVSFTAAVTLTDLAGNPVSGTFAPAATTIRYF